MAGPSKVEFPGQKKQRMRARGTKRASGSVLKRLEKNLAELLDDPHALMPTIAYTVKRARKDPVQRSLKECVKVIAKKHDRKYIGCELHEGYDNLIQKRVDEIPTKLPLDQLI